MIELPADINTILNNPTIETFYAVKIGSLCTTSYFRDITIDGQNFLADGRLVGVEPPVITTSVDRQLFRISLVDVGESVEQFISGSWVARDVSVYLIFVDQLTKQPQLGPTQVFKAYSGIVNSNSLSFDTQIRGNRIYVVSCSNPMIDLEAIRAVYLSQDYIDKNHPGDTSYEQIYEGAGLINLKWGRG
jgi:hypothetical protein